MKHIYGVDGDGQKWVENARKLAASDALPHAAEVDGTARFPKEAVKALGAQGFFGLTLPKESGGAGQPPKVFAAVVEELAQACASTAMIYVMHNAGAQAYSAAKGFAGRADLLKKIAKGDHLTTLAFSEKGSRSHFWAPVSQLVDAGKGQTFTLNAQKSWVTSAGVADSFVTSAQRPGAASALESTIFSVKRGAAGVRQTGTFNGMGLRGNDSAPMTLEGTKIDASDLLTGQGEGAGMMLEVVLPWFAVGTAAMANGLALAAVQATGKHLTEGGFEHLGTKLRDLPNLRMRLANMSMQTEAARALLGYTTALMEAPDAMTPLYVLQSRAVSLKAALGVTDLAMQACGGAAFSKHLGVEKYFRDARAGGVMAPTVDQLEDFVGRALTGLPLF